MYVYVCTRLVGDFSENDFLERREGKMIAASDGSQPKRCVVYSYPTFCKRSKFIFFLSFFLVLSCLPFLFFPINIRNCARNVEVFAQTCTHITSSLAVSSKLVTRKYITSGASG